MTTEYGVEDLLPHSGQMLLIDRVVDWGDDWLVAEVDIQADSLFVEGGYLDALVVIEYMAQTVAALAGIRAKNNDRPIQIGMLLGTRKYACSHDRIAINTTVKVHVKELFVEENGLGVFSCEATAGEVHLNCQLNVYHPPEAKSNNDDAEDINEHELEQEHGDKKHG